MWLLAAVPWLMAWCARGDGSGWPGWRGVLGCAQRGEVVIKRSDVPARNRDGISGLVEVVLEAAVNVVLDGAGHVVVNRPADAITVAPGPWANGIKLMWGLASARRRSWSAASAGQSGRACGSCTGLRAAWSCARIGGRAAAARGCGGRCSRRRGRRRGRRGAQGEKHPETLMRPREAWRTSAKWISAADKIAAP